MASSLNRRVVSARLMMPTSPRTPGPVGTFGRLAFTSIPGMLMPEKSEKYGMHLRVVMAISLPR